jgi:autotransporter-associated beta strand protein
MKRRSVRLVLFTLAAAVVLALCTGPALAATLTWTGAAPGAMWSSASNWSPNVLPANGDSLVFPEGALSRNTMNDLNGLSIDSVSITGPEYDVSGNPLTLTGGISVASMCHATWGIPLVLGAPMAITVASGQAFPLDLEAGIDTRGHLLTMAGTGNTVVTGVIGGSGGFTKSGSGRVDFWAANTYAGDTIVSGGTLAARVLNAVPSGVGNGTTTVAAGAVLIIGDSGQTVNDLSGDGTIVSSLTATAPLTVNSLGDSTFSGVIGPGWGTHGLTKTGAGTLTLSDGNHYAGATTISAGTLRLGADEALPSGADRGSVSIAAGAVLDLSGYDQTVNDLSGAGTVTNSSNDAATLTVLSSLGSEFQGVIADGAGPVALTKTGSGAFGLSGVNTYSGDTNVSDGMLRLRAAGTIPSGTGKGSVTVAAGTCLNLLVGGLAVNDLSGAGVVLITDLAPSSSLVVHSSSPGSTFSGWFSVGNGSLALTKDGPGTFTLSGDSFCDGSIAVGDGTLLITGSVGRCPVTVKSGATFGGGGRVLSLLAEVGGIVWPGAVRYLPAVTSVGYPVAISDSLSVCVADPAGAAGEGYDQLSGAEYRDQVTLGSAGRLFTVKLVSAAGGALAPCAGFDPAQSYRWQVVKAGAGGLVEAGSEVLIDATGFQNDLDGGSFSWETTAAPGGGRYGNVVFTPLADFAGDPVVGGGSSSGFVTGTTQPVTWDTTLAPPTGSVFKLYAVNAASSTDRLIGSVDAGSLKSYSSPWTIAELVSAGWHVRVELWSAASGGTLLRAATSQTFAVLPVTYVITATAGPGGHVFPGSGPVAAGATVTYRFSADPGYHLAVLTVDGRREAPQGSWTFANVSAPHAIVATFVRNQYLITARAGVGGRISPENGIFVPHGGSQSFAIVADAGYRIAEVSVDGASVGAVASYAFTNVSAAHAISATFVRSAFTITPSVLGGSGGHGSVSPATPQSVAAGSTPTFTFTPEPGYHVDAVTVDGSPVAMTATNAYTFPAVGADHRLLVSFAKDAPLPGALSVAAPHSASVKQGHTARLRYRVSQAVLSGTANVTIVVTDKRGVVAKTLQRPGVSLNARHAARFHCTLPKGVYTFKVSATTKAGASGSASNTLTVR